MIQAGAQPISLIQLLCELQRDWARKDTVPTFVQIAQEHGSTFGIQLILEKEKTMAVPKAA